MTTPFTLSNLPYGVISTASDPKLRCATAFEANALELHALEEDGFFQDIPGFEGKSIFGQVFKFYSEQSEICILLTRSIDVPE
jgi:hypothetical protein